MTLQEILVALLRHWKLIVLGAVFTGVVALGMSFAIPPTYEATSALAIAKATVSVNFDQKLRTTTEEEQAYLLRRSQDLEARRKALTALVQNAWVAQRVIDQLGDKLPPELRHPSELVRMVEGESQGDAILIHVRAADPKIAAAIANAWAKEYEKHVNSIYGSVYGSTVGGESVSAVQAEAEKAKQDYLKAQAALEKFIATNHIDEINRQIEEKKAIISSLHEGKKRAVETTVDTELEARSKIISAYVNALTDNLLFAFQKEQEEKKKLLAEYFADELRNRLLALQKDRELREKLFTALVNAEIQARTAVFNQQIEDKTKKLASAYAQRRTLEQLLENAQALYQQVKAGATQATALTSGLAILLLKAQAFASTANLPGKLELSLDSLEGLAVNPQEQLKDLKALIAALEQQIQGLAQSIKEQSTALLQNEGYDFLNVEPSEQDPLSQAIARRYQELFEFGQLHRLGQKDYLQTSLLETIQTKYPELFQIGDIAKLSDLISKGSPLATSATNAAERLLQLQGLENIPSYTTAAEPLAEAINKLDREVNALEAQLEAEQAKKKELQRARDLAWEKYDTLATKVAEVDVASAITGTEVRFASPALVPTAPVSPKKKQNALLGLFAGLILAMGLVLIIEHPAVKSLREAKNKDKDGKNNITPADVNRNKR